jgi:hypothetical protein
MRKSLMTLLLTAGVIAASAPASSAHTRGTHWCRQGQPALLASAATTCQYAGKIIDAYVNVCHEARHCRVHLYMPNSRARYLITCDRTGTHRDGSVYCYGPAGNHIWTRFSAVI